MKIARKATNPEHSRRSTPASDPGPAEVRELSRWGSPVSASPPRLALLTGGRVSLGERGCTAAEVTRGVADQDMAPFERSAASLIPGDMIRRSTVPMKP